MHVKYMLFCGVFGLFLSGCGSVEVHQVFVREPSMIEHRDIEVYVSPAMPKRPYYDIAILQAIGTGNDANLGPVTRALADRGARLGCDAIVRLHIELGMTRAHGSAVCVRWAQVTVLPQAPTPPPAPATSAPTPPTSAPSSGDDSGGTSI